LSANILFAQQVQDSVREQQQQPKQKKNLSEKIYYGGTFGISLGSYTMIGVYPLIAYKFTPKLSAGVKFTYQYVSDSRYSTTFTTSNYGGSVFSRYRVTPRFYAHIEYEQMNYDLYDNINNSSSREWVPFLYVGAGYSQNLGKNVWLNLQVLFDVLQNEKSPYNNWEPFFSIGIGAGF
jgi:hypothetical protein